MWPRQLWILGAGLRVGGPGTSPFGARGMSSVRYGTRLGDLKNKQSLKRSNPLLLLLPRHSYTRRSNHRTFRHHVSLCVLFVVKNSEFMRIRRCDKNPEQQVCNTTTVVWMMTEGWNGEKGGRRTRTVWTIKKRIFWSKIWILESAITNCHSLKLSYVMRNWKITAS